MRSGQDLISCSRIRRDSSTTGHSATNRLLRLSRWSSHTQSSTGNDTHRTRPITAPHFEVSFKCPGRHVFRGVIGEEGDAQDHEQRDGQDEAPKGPAKLRGIPSHVSLTPQVIRFSPRMPTKSTYPQAKQQERYTAEAATEKMATVSEEHSKDRDCRCKVTEICHRVPGLHF